ncbi:hypothetical protein Y032_0257g414 [Ancylostoma ceylanicum]|uniref:Reverse transcriptase domain-containing protein n=1 Tax=Ancylostoma ceylanicum TaxID=53326 RepID=A0A016SAV5_9BILA|nr:hypothetical protein Y032_0257g414 [Ancylostoma ceylanicum]
MYADDPKIYKVISKTEDIDDLQKAIDYVSNWSKTWELPLAVDKSCVLPIGRGPFNPSYQLAGRNLRCATEVRDLGFLINDKLKFASHCRMIASKAHLRTYRIFKALKTKNPQILVKAFKTYVRPIVECGTTVFSPFTKKDIDLLESVQNSFARKLMFRCSTVRYSLIPNGYERRKQLGLFSLHSRRLKNDLIMAFKILKGEMSVEPRDFFDLTPSRTRGAHFKLRVSVAKTQVRSKFFSQRVVSAFNSILGGNVLSMSPQSFRKLAARSVVSH